MKGNARTSFFRSVALLCVVLVAPGDWSLWAMQDPGPPPPASNAPLLPPDQLDSLVAPIALYPDPLVAQILAAATYPLEIVEVDRWLQANQNLTGTALTDAAKQQSWDPSLQAMVVFPAVVKMMDESLRWTTDLGNAFLAQQQDVMDAIQRQRARAQQSGKLQSTPQAVVETTYEDSRPQIVIQPAQPEYIYVPVYDPVAVWGPPVYPYWPMWYPPRSYMGAVVGVGIFSFFVGVGVGSYFHQWGGWGGWGWRPGWGSRTVVINNNFYARNNYRVVNNVNVYRGGYSNWEHNPEHRNGVPYASRGVAQRVGGPMTRDNRPIGQPSRDFRGGGGQPGGGGRDFSRPGGSVDRSGGARDIRPSTPQPPSGGGNNRGYQTQTERPRADQQRNNSAFGGINNGQRARTESDRGHSSLGSRAESPRQAPRQESSRPSGERRR